MRRSSTASTDEVTVGSLLQVALASIVGALLLMSTAIVFVKARRQLRDRRRAALVAEVRPRVMAALENEQAGAAEFRGRRGSVAESIAIALLPNLRGADRDALARILAASGVIARARVGLVSCRPARRQRAAELLGAAGDALAVPALVAALADRDEDVRMAAARSLGRIGAPDAVVPLLDALDDRQVPANTISMSLLRIGAAGSPGLVPALESPTARTRSVAAELAGSFGLGEVRPKLEAMLDDSDETVRQSAARALGRLGVPSSTGTLIARLECELAKDPGAGGDDLAVVLVTALGQIGHPAALPIMTDALTRSHRISFAAASALAGMSLERDGHEHPVGRGARSRLCEILVGREKLAIANHT